MSNSIWLEHGNLEGEAGCQVEKSKRNLKRYCWKTLSMRPHRSLVLGCSDFIYVSRRSLQRSISDEVK